MASSRAPVIRAQRVSGGGGGIGAGISDFLSNLARRKAEEEREEDERVKAEAQIALSHAKARIETKWSDIEAQGLLHGKTATEAVQLRKKVADDELGALKEVGQGRIEYRSVLADGEFWAAGKIDGDTQARKERERGAALSRHVAATATRKSQLEVDTQHLEVMLASSDPKLVNAGFEQMGEIKRERIFLATQTAPGEDMEAGAIGKIEDEFRRLPLRSVLRQAAQSSNLDAYPALKRRIANRTDYAPGGQMRFSGPATQQDITDAYEEFDSIWESSVRQAESRERQAEKAAKTRTKDATTALSRELFRLGTDGQPMIPLDMGLRLCSSSEGFLSGESGATSLCTRYKTWHDNLGEADGAAAQERIASSDVAQLRMMDFREGLAAARTLAQVDALDDRRQRWEGAQQIGKEQSQDMQGQIDTYRKVIETLDREDDATVAENRKRLAPMFRGWQIDAGAPIQGGVTFITQEYSARKSAFYTNAQMTLLPALTKSGLLDSRTLQAVDSMVKAQAATIGDGEGRYHWLEPPDFSTQPSESAGGKTVERLADLIGRAGGLDGLTDAAGFGWIGMHFPHEMRFMEGNAFDEGGTADALVARFIADGDSPERATEKAAHVMGYYLLPGLAVIAAIRSGRSIEPNGAP